MSRAAGDIRVLVVDDFEAVRRGLRDIVDSQVGFTVVGEAETVDDAIALADRARPDVVLMDVKLNPGSGIEATREIRAAHPEIRVLMLSAITDEDAVFASVMAGASGYVVKGRDADALIRAIRMVHKGESLLDPAVTETVFEHLRRGVPTLAADGDRLSLLSPQEERVLTYVAAGMTNREIAKRMHLSDKTVKNYVASILEKLEVKRRAEAATYLAVRRGHN